MSKTFKATETARDWNDNAPVNFEGTLGGAGADWGDWQSRKSETIARRDARQATADYDQKFLKIDGREG